MVQYFLILIEEVYIVVLHRLKTIQDLITTPILTHTILNLEMTIVMLTTEDTVLLATLSVRYQIK